MQTDAILPLNSLHHLRGEFASGFRVSPMLRHAHRVAANTGEMLH
jgi:hypothetical protein